MIKYDKLFKQLEEKGISTYRIKQEGIISQPTYYKIKKGMSGLDYKTVDRLCRILNCQPNDIMEYVPDEEELAS